MTGCLQSLRSGLAAAGLSGLWAIGPAAAEQVCVTCTDPSAIYLCNVQPGTGLLAGTGGQLACLTELSKRGGHDKCSVMRQSDGRCDGVEPVDLIPGTGTQPDAGPNIEAHSQPAPSNATVAAPSSPQPDQAGHGPNTIKHPNEPERFRAVDDDGADPTQAGKQAQDTQPNGPPKTVVEMADRAYQSSKKNLDKAGDAVGDGAKKAGNVVTDTAKKTGEQIGKAGKAIGNAAKKTWDCVTSLFSEC